MPTPRPVVVATGTTATIAEVPVTPVVPTEDNAPIVQEAVPAPVATAVPTVLRPDQEEITLSKEAFDTVMARIASLEKEQQLVAQTQDRNTAAKIEELRRSGKIVKTIRLRTAVILSDDKTTTETKTVIEFKTVRNDVYMIEGKLFEDQVVKLSFKDGTSREVTLREWNSMTDYVNAEVIKVSTDEEGETFFTIRLEDGETLEINIKYVN